MDELTHDTFIGYLQTLPGDNNKYQCVESNHPDVPPSWQYLGTLGDPKLGIVMESYKSSSHYALGFYPFNACDIYRDDESGIRLAYRETSGHIPFIISYSVTKKSPFIIEPVGFYVAVPTNRNDEFILFLGEYGLTPDLIEMDVSYFKDIRYIMDIPAGRAVILRRREDGNEFVYTIAARREDAHAIREWCGYNKQ